MGPGGLVSEFCVCSMLSIRDHEKFRGDDMAVTENSIVKGPHMIDYKWIHFEIICSGRQCKRLCDCSGKQVDVCRAEVYSFWSRILGRWSRSYFLLTLDLNSYQFNESLASEWFSFLHRRT
jgi:hypothetical protein